MSNHARTILVVDDDIRLRALIRRFLEQQGFVVYEAQGLKSTEQILARHRIDLIVLDVMLKDEDGLTVCRTVRQNFGWDIGIIVLTAKEEEIDRIVGLEIGADDYVTKPCNPRELSARISAVLRRMNPVMPRGAPDIDAKKEYYAVGRYQLDTRRRCLMLDGEEIGLSTGEFALLNALVQRPGESLSREQLLELSRGRRFTPYDRSIDMQILRLRKIIEDDPSQPKLIQTVRGFGYVFVGELE